MGTFTVREFCNELEHYEYTKEGFELYKLDKEIDLMTILLESMYFGLCSECMDSVKGSDYIIESSDSEIDIILESIGNKVSKFITGVINAIKTTMVKFFAWAKSITRSDKKKDNVISKISKYFEDSNAIDDDVAEKLTNNLSNFSKEYITIVEQYGDIYMPATINDSSNFKKIKKYGKNSNDSYKGIKGIRSIFDMLSGGKMYLKNTNVLTDDIVGDYYADIGTLIKNLDKNKSGNYKDGQLDKNINKCLKRCVDMKKMEDIEIYLPVKSRMTIDYRIMSTSDLQKRYDDLMDYKADLSIFGEKDKRYIFDKVKPALIYSQQVLMLRVSKTIKFYTETDRVALKHFEKIIKLLDL